ncbi:hypothetical protein EYF80_035544 [Liparis tanakae]|uniref:Uncharacterized protein n=1 Tax=Liparis tanakae TaxID=230148 RepID=A0A4Z2GNC4_9TELE|nr:hypothetical protein EYF80_035544 [Liparis tanakae]
MKKRTTAAIHCPCDLSVIRLNSAPYQQIPAPLSPSPPRPWSLLAACVAHIIKLQVLVRGQDSNHRSTDPKTTDPSKESLTSGAESGAILQAATCRRVRSTRTHMQQHRWSFLP